MSLADYYHDIIPDLAAFKEYAARPLPKTFWLNNLRCQDNVFADKEVQQLSWNPAAFRYLGQEVLGTSWQYKIGLLQIQEEVSMLPVKLLDPKPHERVIDLCAAPGNKTAEIAVAMANTGTVIANDRNYQRMKAMGQIIRRLGLCNITMTVQDALNYQAYPNYFDKVLVDAPCSCEGTFRKRPHKTITPNPRQHRHLASQQIAIVKKAIQLCKPGGRIVYSTCTFAPEENEGVVSAILNKYADQVRIVPIKLDHFIWSDGILQWQDQHYHPDVQHTMRVWPYQNDTGGFYVAVFEKLGEHTPTPASQQFKTAADVMPFVTDLQQRFGFDDEVLARYALEQLSNRGIYMVNQDHQLPDELSKDVSGLIFLKMGTNFPKLSTGAAMIIGSKARRHVIALTDAQFNRYLQRHECVLEQQQLSLCDSTGFVLVTYRGYAAGLGLYLSAHNERPPRLQSLFPKYLTPM